MTERRDSPAVVASAPTDAELFEALATGQLGPLGVLFDRHHAAVRQFLTRVLPRQDEVDDLVQETFLTASRAAGSFDGALPARPFLLGIAAQLVRRRKRTFARLRRLVEALGRSEAAAPPSPEEAAMDRSERAQLERAVLALPEDLRIVLVLVEANGLSGVEVARTLGIPAGTVWRRLHDARAALKMALTRGAR